MNMGLFRRTESYSSSKSRKSTNDSVFESATPRSSTDTNDLDETVILNTTTSKHQPAPILGLPIELLQQITSYLDTATSASLSLSSRYTYYALGTNHLSTYVGGSKSRFEKRKTIEAVVERAFPGHWFCAWCDKFHSWTPSDGPTTSTLEKGKECAEYNSYLHDSNDYILYYHHIRLAINHSLWGPEHGLPLSSFTFTKSSIAKISKTPIPTQLDIQAKVVDGHFLLHTTFTLLLPMHLTTHKSLLPHLWPILPHILAGHRESPNGHTGLMAAIDNTVRRNWSYLYTQTCASCATDWTVACHHFAHTNGGQARLVVQSWRNLGAGRNPFDTKWRAHGVCVRGTERCGGKDGRGVGVQAGDVRRAFESADASSRAERTASPARARIYKAFMRRSTEEDGVADADADVRRSRARPMAWRTRSENEEVFRRGEEERVEVARQVAESLVRLDAERGRS
jgi:hypothetical protein